MRKIGSIEDIEVGMVVTVRPCGVCGEEHTGRVFKTGSDDAGLWASGLVAGINSACLVRPSLPCTPYDLPWAVVPEMVAAGVVFAADAVN
jgi:hypothetical protein